MAAVIADGRDRELCQLPPVELAHLGGGHPELGANSPQQAAHHHPLRFQRSGSGQVKDDASDTDRYAGRQQTFPLAMRDNSS
jgi:hypothetical protein